MNRNFCGRGSELLVVSLASWAAAYARQDREVT